MGTFKETLLNRLSEVQDLQIQCYSDHPEVYKMADLVVDSYVATKKRAHRQKYVRSARKLIASLWLHPSDWFRFSTKDEHFGKKKKQVWLTREVLTLFKHMRGMAQPFFTKVVNAIPPALSKSGIGFSAIYCRSSHFRQMLQSLELEDIIVDPDLSRLSLKNDRDEYISFSKEDQNSAWFKSSEETLINHSAMLSRAQITLSSGRKMLPFEHLYFRRFKGSTRLTGRLYAPFINWHPEDRLAIKFDGIPAACIDISSLNPVLILRLKHGLDKEPEGLFKAVSDPYDVPFFSHIPRAVQKSVINCLFNCTTEKQAVSALLATEWWEENGKIKTRVRDGKQKRKGQPAFIGKSEEIKRYIETFKTFHPYLREAYGTGIGNFLQWIDSELMLFILRRAIEDNIPVLPVHDEVVFPEDKVEWVMAALIAAFWFVLGERGQFGDLKIKLKINSSGGVIQENQVLHLGRDLK